MLVIYGILYQVSSQPLPFRAVFVWQIWLSFKITLTGYDKCSYFYMNWITHVYIRCFIAYSTWCIFNCWLTSLFITISEGKLLTCCQSIMYCAKSYKNERAGTNLYFCYTALPSSIVIHKLLVESVIKYFTESFILPILFLFSNSY